MKIIIETDLSSNLKKKTHNNTDFHFLNVPITDNAENTDSIPTEAETNRPAFSCHVGRVLNLKSFF
jgi:hypothetical protein